MTSEQACARLNETLARDSAGRFTLPCKKAFLLLKLSDGAGRIRFGMQDHVVFRVSADHLCVEVAETGAVKKRILWEHIECLAVGEPEVDNGPLFQG